MSKYLRDQYLKSISITESSLRNIDSALQNIASELNNNFTDASVKEEAVQKVLVQSFIIRFDNRGFRLSSIEDVIKYFNEAKKIERVILILDSTESYLSNRLNGKCIEINFDALDINNCFIRVQDDNKEWVDASICNLLELLNKNKNKHYLIRNYWITFTVQILGVIAGFVLSIWAAQTISPLLDIDYSFVVTFVIAFIVFSNGWTFINPLILRALNQLFPNIYFKRKVGLHWLVRSLIGALFVALFLYLVNLIFMFTGDILNSIIK